MPSGGDITEITYNHPTLGSGVIFPKSNESSNYDVGGFRSADDANMVDGSGKIIDQKNRVRWSFEVPIAIEMVSANTMQELANLAASPVEANWTFTNINGSVFKGSGFPVGDLAGDGNTSMMTLKVSGSGTLQRL
jgi:hypothetical protein